MDFIAMNRPAVQACQAYTLNHVGPASIAPPGNVALLPYA